jgi:hypothetical protein
MHQAAYNATVNINIPFMESVLRNIHKNYIANAVQIQMMPVDGRQDAAFMPIFDALVIEL